MPTLIDRQGRRPDPWIRPAADDAAASPDGGAVAAAAAAAHSSIAAATSAAVSVPVPAGPGTSEPRRHLLLPLADWLAQREALLAEVHAGGGPANARLRLGVELGPADEPGVIAADLPSLSLVAVHFPRFTDGRGYSIARTLRGHLGWQGELRATGDILRDQLFYLTRCGFDTFALRDDQNVDASLGAFRSFSEAYQAAVDRGPLFERRRDSGVQGLADRNKEHSSRMEIR